MKSSVRWLLFEYQGLELVILSKPFKTKKLAEKARPKGTMNKSELLRALHFGTFVDELPSVAQGGKGVVCPLLRSCIYPGSA